MKVFISWSGPTSKKLGDALRNWLPAALQGVVPYFTPADIEKGTRWGNEIAKELEATEVGVLCLTPDNIHSDWLLFEAGALSKKLDKARVCPLLFGMENSDLKGPLIQFQTATFNREDVAKLFTTINSTLGERKLAEDTLATVFDKWWPDLEAEVQGILAEAAKEDDKPIRTERDMLEELVETTRQIQQKSATANDINGAALTHLIENYLAVYHATKARESHDVAMVKLAELVKSVRYITQKLSTVVEGASDFELISLESLSFECDPYPQVEDDIPF